MQRKENRTESMWCLPYLFSIVLIPVIVRNVLCSENLEEYSWYPKTWGRFDAFMWWKSIAVILLGAVLLLVMILCAGRAKIRFQKILLPLGVYAGLVIFSTVCSIDRTISVNGFFDMYESVYVILSYVLLTIYGAVICWREEMACRIERFTGIGICLIGAIGFTQFIGRDLYQAEFMRGILNVAGRSRKFFSAVYASLYNPNYVGMYCCMLIPFVFVLCTLHTEKKKQILWFICATVLMMLLVGCRSKSTTLLLIPCLLFCIFLLGRNRRRRAVIVMCLFLLLYLGFNLVYTRAYDSNLLEKTFDTVCWDGKGEDDYRLTDIFTDDDGLRICYDGKEYLLVDDTKTGQLLLEDTTTKERKKLPLQELRIAKDANGESDGYTVTSEGYSFSFVYDKTAKKYLYRNFNGCLVELVPSKTWDCPLFHVFGGMSGRGYIWRKSVPLLSDSLFLGSGADTYALRFPQQDYISIVHSGYGSQYITKPHNLYLQIGIQSGVGSLLALAVFYGWYFISSVRLYRRCTFQNPLQRTGMAAFVAATGYLCSGMLNDSTIGVSIIFYSLLGIGIGCNKQIVKQL